MVLRWTAASVRAVVGWMLQFSGQHRRRPMQWLLVLAVLGRAWVSPALRRWIRRTHYRITAESPRLHYQRTPENDRILADCKTMTQDKYYPLWYLVNGHLQTLQLAREMKERQPLVLYERQILDMPDGGIISLDWALPPRDDGTVPRVSELHPRHRTMLILPGLTGGSDEFYIRALVKHMVELGWQVVVMNARGCAETPLKSPQFFCVAYTGDLRHVVAYFHETYDFLADTFVVVGFSLGSNVVVKYLGEEGAGARVSAAVSVGNPFDIVKCAERLSSSFFYRNTYDATLNNNLKRLFFHESNAHEIFRHHPDLDLDAVRGAKYLYDFDEHLTRKLFSYPSVHHFYTDASSGSRIPLVRVPLLCLNAEDDPICTAEAIPYEAIAENPHVILCVTRSGGHLAYYEGEREDAASAPPQQQQQQQQRGRHSSGVWSVRAIAEYAESIRRHRALAQ